MPGYGMWLNNFMAQMRVRLRFEELVRPFMVDVTSLPENREPHAPDFVRPEAYIAWGDPSDFDVDDFRQKAASIVFEDDEEDKRARYQYTEEARGYRDFKIMGPDLSSYIILRAATASSFRGPDGAQFLLNMAPGRPGQDTGSGQSPPSPPPLEEIP